MIGSVKFRGRRWDGEWVYGYYLYDDIHKEHFILTMDMIGNIRESKVDPETVAQFTGLTDKKGVEIYGDDVVKYKISPNWITDRVYYSEEWAQWFKGNNQSLSSYKKSQEVVGNIHDNKDLKR